MLEEDRGWCKLSGPMAYLDFDMSLYLLIRAHSSGG